MSIRDAFQMPSPIKITGRSSSITAAFVTSIIPAIEPSEAEIEKALNILGIDPNHVQCAFCGTQSTEWDHLRPLVVNKKPTGYITDIRNLVPACGKCNQSKGNKDWKTWILSDAKRSPKSRGVPNLARRIRRLELYEKWGRVHPFNLELLTPKELWQTYWKDHQAVLDELRKAQVTANKVKESINSALTNHSSRRGPATRTAEPNR